ncbi:MAG TPA: 3'-5' exonuclease [Flavobacterium sp.]|jgi:DNA polymerase-3 subunit epsilon
MLDWLKNINKEYPDFWKTYLAKFEKKPARYVILSAHTSGNNPVKDVIYSFGAIAVVNNEVIIGDSFEVVLLQYKYLHDNGLPNTFLVESKLPKMPEPQAVEALVNYIGNAVLVGHRIHYDVELINEALEKLHCGRLKNEALDIEIMYRKWKDVGDKHFTIDELCKDFNIPLAERVNVTEDAYNVALLFLKLKARLNIN